MNKQGTSWGNVADWYEDHLEGEDTYHAAVVMPNLLRAMAPKKGQRIVDIACGSGVFARELAKAGAAVSGADISPELIEKATTVGPRDISYVVAPAERLEPFADASFDKASCVLAIQNIKDVGAAFAEAARVLRSNGSFFVVMNHPAFRVPGASSWGWDEKAGKQYRRVDSYMSERSAEIAMHPGSDPSEKTLSFHRPLQYYVKAAAKAGFAVRRLEEWISHRTSQPGPRQAEEDRIRKEIPLFLMLELVKIGV